VSTMELLEQLRGGLIVSCQASPESPLYGPSLMAAMAAAAVQGGAVGIRANGPEDIAAIRARVTVPIIGLWKQHHPGSAVYITPTPEAARAVARAGADLIALDATARPRPGGGTLRDLIAFVHQDLGRLVMADVSTLAEGEQALMAGADVLATTLAGYTPTSRQQQAPDLQLVAELAALGAPVVAEGRLRTPFQVAEAFRRGAFAVVVGTAITDPIWLTRQFARATPRGPRERP